MGGWIACLCALVRPERIEGLCLVAPAADFTAALMRPALDAGALADLAANGVWRQPSAYGDPSPITARLLDEGDQWLILGAPVPVRVPVRILQGGMDPDVPWRHAFVLADSIEAEDLVFTLVRDGDHRLSRPQDLDRLASTLDELLIRLARSV